MKGKSKFQTLQLVEKRSAASLNMEKYIGVDWSRGEGICCLSGR